MDIVSKYANLHHILAVILDGIDYFDDDLPRIRTVSDFVRVFAQIRQVEKRKR